MTEIRLSSVQELAEQACHLLKDNFGEVRPGEPWVTNWDFFAAAEASGLIFCLASVSEGYITGYSVTFVCPDPHSGRTVAKNDVIYLHPDHRRGMTAVRLIKATESEAARRGAAWIEWNPLSESRLSKLFDRRGYKARSVVYRKEL